MSEATPDLQPHWLKYESDPDIEEELIPVMAYLDEHTGITNEHTKGDAFLGEGGNIIQWYARRGAVTDHALRFVQGQPGVYLSTITTRSTSHTGDDVARNHHRQLYMEIRPVDDRTFDTREPTLYGCGDDD